MRIETTAVRAARGESATTSSSSQEASLESGIPHVPQIDMSTTYGFRSSSSVAASMDALLEGECDAPNPVYARLHNPTVARFEDALAQLEGAEAAVAFASGMAATTALLIAASLEETGRREHVVAVRPVYGGSDHLMSTGMLGTEVTWVDSDSVGEAIRSDTGLVFIETPANPTLELIDIEAVSRQIKSAENRVVAAVPLAVDSTFATPILQNPIALGADLVLHSATKFLGGHGDVMGGVIACSEDYAARLRQVRMVTGGLLHPLGGYLLHRGLQTLPVRVLEQQRNAIELSKRLSDHASVRSVHFPRYGRDGHAPVPGQMRGPGSVLSFCVQSGISTAGVVERLGLITPAVSLGSVDTLIQAPALLTHRIVDAADRTEAGISEDLLRLSVGLENVEDLWADLDQALAIGV
ncbi:MAG: cystathionine gamma-synthase [Gemmatimonadetes bacterium]|nr:cystathionine gamma-synthase [Gemmatimonadota bacterium]